MDSSGVIIKRTGAVLHVMNDNVRTRNALSAGYYRGLIKALHEADEDPAIAAVVLSGAGGFFCSGGDLNVLKTRAATSHGARVDAINGLHDVIRAILACPRPVIAAIEGGAAGAGVALALACDLIIAADDAYFSVAYVKIGLPPDGGTTGFLGALAPRQLVNELCMFGDKLPVQRLHSLGAVNKVTPPGQALAQAVAWGERLAMAPPAALATIKSLVARGQESQVADQLEREVQAMATAQGGAEAAEGIAAFLGKRPPDFGRFRK